ncbi:MAG: chorismate synthase [Candidatus Goldiibacteriota bacterium HGW-Goldbacteria-1]|jgi:chorismate synthase|nr:MAG: chorismate synthase [Candidatus Goldiibacteriota bacterium HGW-Goldbacteria-1]
MLRFLTAGESHGKGLTVIIDGVPSNIKLSPDDFDCYLAERQKGYGRGGRQKIETDRAEIISGIRFGKTTGAPISVFIKNKDFENWAQKMDAWQRPSSLEELNIPRPGHADLSGGIRYNHKDFRNVLERASARETAARVITGALAVKFLKLFGVEVFGFTDAIAGVAAQYPKQASIKDIKKLAEEADAASQAQLRFPDKNNSSNVKAAIDMAVKEGDTLGGVLKIITSKLPPGLGDYTQWDRKLDAKLAMALMSLQAVKGVEIGAGFAYAAATGSSMHDEIFYSKKDGYYRKTNNSGGIEGGMTNGNPVEIKAALKPISTVLKGLKSVNVKNKKAVKTVYERSDVCAVPAAALIAETIVAAELMKAFQEKFGSGDIDYILSNYENYKKYVKKYRV